MNTFTSSIVFSFMLALSPLASANDHDRDRGGRHQDRPLALQAVERMHHALKKLDLSQQQKQSIKSEFTTMREEIKPLMEELRAGRAQLHEILTADAYDAADLSAVAEQQGQVTADMIRITGATIHAVMGHLSEAQRGDLTAMRENRQQRMQERMEHLQERLERMDNQG